MPARHRARLIPAFLSVLAALALATACGDSDDGDAASASDGADGEACVESFDPDTDYFPDKLQLEHASNLTIEYEKSYQVVTVEQPYPDGPPESYVLLRCGAPTPELSGDLASAPVIEVPVTSVYAGSTTQLSMFAELDQVGVLTGVRDAEYISTPEVRERIEAGTAVEYAVNDQVDTETVLSAQPDVVLTGGFELDAYPTLREAGIPVVAHTSWLESTPLGRAEWIALVAALTGTEAKATEVFDEISTDYADIVATVADAQPTLVLPGDMVQGTWSAPAGDGYQAALLADAGGSYPWADTAGTGNLKLDLETVLTEAADIPLWIASSTDWPDLAAVLATDPRYAEFAAMDVDAGGQVWTYDKFLGPTGGNLYFELGATRPDLVLADLAAILHPDLMPDHESTFYRQLG